MAVSLTQEQERELLLFTKQKEIDRDIQIETMQRAKDIDNLGEIEKARQIAEITGEITEKYAQMADERTRRSEGIQLAVALITAVGGIAAAGMTTWATIQSGKNAQEAAKIQANAKLTLIKSELQ